MSAITGLPDGYYQNGMDIGSKFYVKPSIYITQSLIFNGTTQQAVLSNGSYYNNAELPNGGTAELWIKVPTDNPSSNTNQGLLVKDGLWGVFLYNNLIAVYNWVSSQTFVNAGQLLNDDKWHHIAITFNPGVFNGSNVYIDGVSSLNYTMSYSATTNVPLVIGSGYNKQYTKTSISYIRIWNTIKDATFIKQYYYQYLNPVDYPDLIGLYSFSEGAGVGIANSSTRNAYTFTTIGSPNWSNAYPPIINSTLIIISPVVQVVTVVPFSASTYTGCWLWMDGSDTSKITQTSNAVSAWTDKSTNAFSFTQTTSGNRPTYSTNSLNGLSTISFNNANNQYLIKPSTFGLGTNSFSMFIVFKLNTTSSASIDSIFAKSKWADGQGRFWFYREGNLLNFDVQMDPEGTGATTYRIGGFINNSTSWQIAELMVNRVAGNSTVYINGAQVATKSYTNNINTSVNLTNNSDMIIGAYNSSSGSGVNATVVANTYFNGSIAEIIGYSTSTDMTTNTRQKIEGYLAWKWGLQTSLPTGHLYLNSAPTF